MPIPLCFPKPEGKDTHRGDRGKEDLHASTTHVSSYFEIPNKEGHMANNGIHEIPTKDTDSAANSQAAAGEKTFQKLKLLLNCKYLKRNLFIYSLEQQIITFTCLLYFNKVF